MPRSPYHVPEEVRQDSTSLRQPHRSSTSQGDYPLINIVIIAICAVICGADDFVAIADFGRTKRKWFSRFLDLKEGIPSHDRFNAIFAAIKPAEFEQVFAQLGHRVARD